MELLESDLVKWCREPVLGGRSIRYRTAQNEEWVVWRNVGLSGGGPAALKLLLLLNDEDDTGAAETLGTEGFGVESADSSTRDSSAGDSSARDSESSSVNSEVLELS